jgi:hypothetical protein
MLAERVRFDSRLTKNIYTTGKIAFSPANPEPLSLTANMREIRTPERVIKRRVGINRVGVHKILE